MTDRPARVAPCATLNQEARPPTNAARHQTNVL